MDLVNLSTDEIVDLYPQIIKELKKREVIRTNNFIGEIGEYIVIKYYKNTPGLPALQAAPISTKNIDAISNEGERYSIKSTSSNVTGVFYGLEPLGSNVPDKQKFEYVVICVFDEDYSVKAIYEMNWESFLKHKKWHSRMKAWNLSLAKSTLSDCKVIFERKDN